jgi:hypothetical protein
MRNAHKLLGASNDGNTPLGTPTSGRRIILKWILKVYDGMDWIHLVQGKDQ